MGQKRSVTRRMSRMKWRGVATGAYTCCNERRAAARPMPGVGPSFLRKAAARERVRWVTLRFRPTLPSGAEGDDEDGGHGLKRPPLIGASWWFRRGG
jgi:hypothetical protein